MDSSNPIAQQLGTSQRQTKPWDVSRAGAATPEAWTPEGRALLAEHERFMVENPVTQTKPVERRYRDDIRDMGPPPPDGIRAWAYNLTARAKAAATTRPKANDTAERQSKAAQDRGNRERRRKSLGIPARVWPYLDNLADTDAIAAVNAFLADRRLMFLVLRGDKGVGKTLAGCYAVERRGGRIVEAQDIVEAGQFDKAFWPEVREANVLVIDEVGSESMDPKGTWYGSALFSLLNKRYDNMRKTILAGNISRVDFEMRYLTGQGERLRDRLRECGLDHSIRGGSMRQTADVPAREPGEEG